VDRPSFLGREISEAQQAEAVNPFPGKVPSLEAQETRDPVSGRGTSRSKGQGSRQRVRT